MKLALYILILMLAPEETSAQWQPPDCFGVAPNGAPYFLQWGPIVPGTAKGGSDVDLSALPRGWICQTLNTPPLISRNGIVSVCPSYYFDNLGGWKCLPPLPQWPLTEQAFGNGPTLPFK